MNLSELVEKMRELSSLVDGGVEMMRIQAQAHAEAERNYRKAVAEAYLRVPDGTVDEKAAWVKGETADLRYERDLARGMERAADVAVRARTTQVSAWQTAVNAERTEMDFAKYSPEMTP